MFTTTLPHYEFLNEEQLAQIEEMSFRLLEEIGVQFNLPEALDILAAAGLEVDREQSRVRLPREFILAQVAKAPSQFTLHARNPQHSVVIGGANMVCAPTYGPPFVLDLDGNRRDAYYEDFINFVKLAQSTPLLHCAGGVVCEPEDLPVPTRHLDMQYALGRYSDMPYMGSVVSRNKAEDSVALAAILHGGADKLRAAPGLLSLVNVNSPLVYDERMLEAILVYARAGQGLIITPFLLAGAMGPVGLGGVLAQQNAEALTGIALAQYINPGTPVVYGAFLTNVDLQNGSPAFGTPEMALGHFASAQMARRYHLPYRGGGGLTTSKVCDAQAGYEAALGLWPTFLARTNFVLHAAGWLEAGLVASYDKFVLDLELLGILSYFWKGLPLDETSMAWEAFAEIGPAGNFLGATHTIEHFRTAFYRPIVSNTDGYDRWQRYGSTTAPQRANALARKMLAEYQLPAIDPAVDEALHDYIARRKEAIEKEGDWW